MTNPNVSDFQLLTRKPGLFGDHQQTMASHKASNNVDDNTMGGLLGLCDSFVTCGDSAEQPLWNITCCQLPFKARKVVNAHNVHPMMSIP